MRKNEQPNLEQFLRSPKQPQLLKTLTLCIIRKSTQYNKLVGIKEKQDKTDKNLQKPQTLKTSVAKLGTPHNYRPKP